MNNVFVHIFKSVSVAGVWSLQRKYQKILLKRGVIIRMTMLYLKEVDQKYQKENQRVYLRRSLVQTTQMIMTIVSQITEQEKVMPRVKQQKVKPRMEQQKVMPRMEQQKVKQI